MRWPQMVDSRVVREVAREDVGLLAGLVHLADGRVRVRLVTIVVDLDRWLAMHASAGARTTYVGRNLRLPVSVDGEQLAVGVHGCQEGEEGNEGCELEHDVVGGYTAARGWVA